MTTTVGISKLYLSSNEGLLFWIGIAFMLVFIVIFALVSKTIHQNIKKLRDL